MNQETIDRLKQICDKCFEIDDMLKELIDNYNSTRIEAHRERLLPEIGKKIKERDAAEKYYIDNLKNEIKRIIGEYEENNSIQYLSDKVMSWMDTSNDNSRYNRIHRLSELDSYIQNNIPFLKKKQS